MNRDTIRTIIYNTLRNMPLRANQGEPYDVSEAHPRHVSRQELYLGLRGCFDGEWQPKLSLKMLDDVINCFCYDPRIQFTFCDRQDDLSKIPANLIPFRNGYYDISHGKMVNAAQQIGNSTFSYFIDANYISPEYRSHPTFDRFIETSFPIEAAFLQNPEKYAEQLAEEREDQRHCKRLLYQTLAYLGSIMPMKVSVWDIGKSNSENL